MKFRNVLAGVASRTLAAWVIASALSFAVIAVILIPAKEAHADIGVWRQAQVWTTNTFSNPAAGSQATISQPALVGGKHVLDCVGFSAGSTTAPVLTALQVNIRDGATGAGSVRHTWTVIIPAGTGQNVAPFHVCGLEIVGSTNTAMTVEFSAGLANLIEAVNMEGHDTQPNQ